MAKLTPEGEKIVAALADRYAIGVDSVKMMLDAVARGGGSMAQFNLPEFGGNGQWMRGGMTMVGDMFNNSMKATVDNLCNDLSKVLESQPNIMTTFCAAAAKPEPEPGKRRRKFLAVLAVGIVVAVRAGESLVDRVAEQSAVRLFSGRQSAGDR